MKASPREIRAIVMTPNAPAHWPSVSIILPEFLRLLDGIFPKLQRYDFLTEKHLPKKSDVWIFPSGSVQTYALNWLKANYPDPSSRPPAIFLLGGEGAKLGYHLFHYQSIFRAEDRWVVACEAEKALLEDLFPGNARTHVMHHPVASQFRPAANAKTRQALRRKLGFSPSDRVILYAGRLSQQKNLPPLLELLKLSPRLRLLICGDVDSVGVPHLLGAKPQHVPSALIEQIGRMGLSKRVEFRPFLSQPDLRAVMQACDYQASLSAHYGEDFGYSIAQGLCSGLKTILSDWGGHRNWIPLAEEKQVSYVALHWPEGAEIGQPDLSQKLMLPTQNLSTDFHRQYQKMLRVQFLEILNSALTHAQSSQGPFQVSEKLARFWKEAAQKRSSGMFDSASHPMFRKVLSYYLGA